MKNFLAFSCLLSAGVFLTAGLSFGQTLSVTGSSSSEQKLTSSGGSLTVGMNGVLNVAGGNPAVYFNASSSGYTFTVTNNGTIEQSGTAAAGNNGNALVDNAGHTTIIVNNEAGATIETADDDTFHLSKASNNVTLNNYGTINSMNASLGSNQAINWDGITSGSNTLNNYAGGIIEATASDAVRPGVNGVIVNQGEIFSQEKGTSTGSDGIEAVANSGNAGNTGVNITNTYEGQAKTGLIEGGRHGITGGNTDTTTDGTFTMSVSNSAGAIIQGDNGSGINIDGFSAKEVVTIMNSGTISGNGSKLTGTNTSVDGDGVDVDGLVNLTNSGTIESLNSINDTSEGVTVGGGTIINNLGGIIEGEVAAGNTSTATGRGITLAGLDKDPTTGASIPTEGIFANTTVTNSGMIVGQSDAGIAVTGAANAFTVTITNNAGGVIRGGGTVAVIQTGGNVATVTNLGEIDGSTSGKAVDLGSGNSSLAVKGGAATILGDISGGTGTSSFTVDPGAGQSFSYAGVISNFATVQNKSGTVTFTGANLYSGATTISGGTTYINNHSGSGTGTSSVGVSNGATLGGTGTVQPMGTNAITVSAGGTIVAGGVQPAAVSNGTTNTANGSFKVDTTKFTSGMGTAPNAILNINSANLTFALGSGDRNSGSQIMITNQGVTPVANTVAFTGSSTVTINDLVAGHLTLNQEYVLMVGDDTTYSGLMFDPNTSPSSPLGQRITGGLALLAPTSQNYFSENYTGSQLYLVGDDIDVEVVPEPGTWTLMLGGAGALALILRRRFKALTV
jgi:hypothetical protein